MKSLQEMLDAMRKASIAYKKYVMGEKLEKGELELLETIKTKYKIEGTEYSAEDVLHYSFKTFYSSYLDSAEDIIELQEFIDAVKLKAEKDTKLQDYYSEYLQELDHDLLSKKRDADPSPTTTDSTATSRSVSPRDDEAMAKEISTLANAVTLELRDISRQRIDVDSKLAEIKLKLDFIVQKLADSRSIPEPSDELNIAIYQLGEILIAAKVMWSRILSQALSNAQNANDFTKFANIVRDFELTPKLPFLNPAAETEFDDMSADHRTAMGNVYNNFTFGRYIPILLINKRINTLKDENDFDELIALRKFLENAYIQSPNSLALACYHLTNVRKILWNCDYLQTYPREAGQDGIIQEKIFATMESLHTFLNVVQTFDALNIMLNIPEAWQQILKYAFKHFAIDPDAKQQFSSIKIPTPNDLVKLTDLLLEPIINKYFTTERRGDKTVEKSANNPPVIFGKDLLGEKLRANFGKKPGSIRYRLKPVAPEELRQSLDQLLINIKNIPSFKIDEVLNKALVMQENYIASFDRSGLAVDLAAYYAQYVMLADQTGGVKYSAKLMDYLIKVVSLTQARYADITNGKNFPHVSKILADLAERKNPDKFDSV